MKPECKNYKQHRSRCIPYKSSLNKYSLKNIYYPLQGDKKHEKDMVNKAKMPAEFEEVYEKMMARVKIFFKKAKSNNTTGFNFMFRGIVTKEFLGSHQNIKKLYALVQKCSSRSMHECMFVKDLSDGFNLNKIPWLANVPLNERNDIFTLSIRKVMNNAVLPLFSNIYRKVVTGQIYEIRFVHRDLLNTFLLKAQNSLINKGYIKEVDPSNKTIVGSLYLKAKNDLDDPENCRPFVQYGKRKAAINRPVKKKMITLLYSYASSLCFTKREYFYEPWKIYAKLNEKQIFGAKIDLANCFTNVDTEVLKQILKKSNLCHYDIKKLCNLIDHQYVTFRKKADKTKVNKVWKWNKGLLQGAEFSGPLCEVYMSYMDGVLFREFNIPDCFLHRTVDDYFFCSTNIEDVKRFLEICKRNFEINEGKLETNAYDLEKNTVRYNGHIVNLDTREIRIFYNFSKQTELRYKFKIWNSKLQVTREKIMLRSMYRPYNNFYFSKIVLNLDYNSEDTSLSNFFEGMLLLAFKFDCALRAVYVKNKLSERFEKFLNELISLTVWNYSHIARSKLIGFKEIKIQKFLKRACSAFYLVLNKRQLPIYRKIVNNIKGLRDININKIPHPFDNIAMKRNTGVHFV